MITVATAKSFVFHGITFNNLFAGIYKNDELQNELYFDSEVRRMGPAGNRFKVKILVNNIVVIESKMCKSFEEAIAILESKTKPFLKLCKKES